MREIKFRAWDKEKKRFVDNDYTFSIFLSGKTDVKEENGDTNKLFERSSSDFVVMQYTGLKDKNGKEIYEGDILSISHEEKIFIATPQYSLAYMGWALCDPKNILSVPHYTNGHVVKECSMSEYVEFLRNDCPYMEIIGNIHENY